MSLSWDDLFQRGSIVSLELGYWRARTELKAADLGIPESPDVQAAFSLGCHRLVPPNTFKELIAVHRSTRKIVDELSVTFSLIPGSRFVPEGTLPRLLDELGTLKDRHNELVAEFLAKYEDVKREQLPTLRRALREAAHDDEAADAAYHRLKAEFPTDMDEVEAKFRFGWNVYAVAGPQTKAAARALNDESGQVREVIQQFVRGLRDELREQLQGIAAQARRGGKLPTSSVTATRELCQRLEAMNVLQDVELSNGVRMLRQLIEGAGAEDMDKGFIKTLNQINDELGASVRDAQARAEAVLTATGKRKIRL